MPAQPTPPREPPRVWDCWGAGRRDRPYDPQRTIALAAKQLRTIAKDMRRDDSPRTQHYLVMMAAHWTM